MEYLHKNLTDKIIRAYFNVYNKLGYGFLEKNYENSMIELKKMGLSACQQVPIKVYYDSEIVGDYYADIQVEGKVIIELKAATAIIQKHEVQLLNYLKATNLEVGLLLNFGIKPEIKRRVFENRMK